MLTLARIRALARLACVCSAMAIALMIATTTAYALSGTGGIQGTVYESGTANPIWPVTVWAFTKSGANWNVAGQTSVDTSGHYNLTLPASTSPYDLDFYPNTGNWVKWVYNGALWCGLPGSVPVTVTAGTTVTVDAPLFPGGTYVASPTSEATGGPLPLTLNWLVVDTIYGTGSSSTMEHPTYGEWPGILYECAVQASATWTASFYRNADGSTGIRATVATITVPIRVRHRPSRYHDTIRKTAGTRWQTSVTDAWENTPYPSAADVNWRYVTDVVIASGTDAGAADALAAAGLAGAYNVGAEEPGAPLLLVSQSTLNTEVRNALKAMPTGIHVHIVGGSGTISDAVRSQIAAVSTVASVDRIWGLDRYRTATAVAAKMKSVLLAQGKPAPTIALIANGQDPAKFFDALALSPVAWKLHAPILLVGKDVAPASTLATLKGFSATKRYMAGGTGTISEAIRKKCAAFSANRLWGANRYSTATAIDKKAISAGWVSYYDLGVTATQTDALAGGVSIGQAAGLMVLTSPTGLPSETRSFILAHKPTGYVLIYGSAASIPEQQRLYIQTLVN